MRFVTRLAVLWLAASVVLLAAGAPASAAPKRITGKLTKSGYTVIALAAGGKASSVQVRSRGFRLRPPARVVTLHLRARNGRYAGPVVARRARKGRRAIVGVRAGTRLGRVRVRRGYATVAKRLGRKSIDRRRRARARRGVPIGNGRNFGRVRARSRGGSRLGQDRDLDGVPNLLDIDDDGDLVLDNLDRSSAAARAAQFAPAFNPFSSLGLDLAENVNANATGATTEQIDTALSRRGALVMGVLRGDTAELDCAARPNPTPPPEFIPALVYCSPGGTGVLGLTGEPFPECCDADNDGFGALTPGGPFGGTHLNHGATTDQIRTGDLLIQRVTTGGVETEFPTPLQFVFATVPALVSYSDGAGNSRTVSYPVRGHPDPSRCPPDCSGPDPGIRGNGFPVAPRPAGDPNAGDVVLTLTFWRPQRKRIANDPAPGPGASSEWTDIGGLTYTAGVADTGAFCPQPTFSDPRSEPTPNQLVPATGPVHRPGAGGFNDLATDAAANDANRFSYTLNVTRCLAANGLPPWNPGEERGLALSALGANTADEAQLNVFFKRE